MLGWCSRCWVPRIVVRCVLHDEKRKQLLPVTKTNLEDHEATTRQMSCLSLEVCELILVVVVVSVGVILLFPSLLVVLLALLLAVP